MSTLLLAACFSNAQLKSTDADSAPPPGPSWQPGDPIPGWDDYPCEEEAPSFDSSDTVVLPLHSMAAKPLCIVPSDDQPCDLAERPWETDLRYCVTGDHGNCLTDDTRQEAMLLFWGDEYAWPEPRGQGWYDFRGGLPARAGDFYLRTPDLGAWQAHDPAVAGYDTLSPDGLGCLSRVRPDNLAGTVWLIFSKEYQDLLGLPEALVLGFDVLLPDHGGVDVVAEEVPAEIAAVHYTYMPATDYDAFWPWDDITDPDIRQQVYDRYLPYGWEGHEF